MAEEGQERRKLALPAGLGAQSALSIESVDSICRVGWACSSDGSGVLAGLLARMAAVWRWPGRRNIH